LAEEEQGQPGVGRRRDDVLFLVGVPWTNSRVRGMGTLIGPESRPVQVGSPSKAERGREVYIQKA